MPTYNTLPKPSPFFHGKCCDKLVGDLRLAGMAKRTVYGYVRAIHKLAEFHQKSPDTLSESDIRVYLLHQIVELEVASGTQSVILSGIKFFYRTTLPRNWKVLDQTKIGRVVALPEVITQAQVFEMTDAATTFRLKCFLWITYTLGLRIGEAVNLQNGDVDSERPCVKCPRCGGDLELLGITDADGKWLWRREQPPREQPTRGPPIESTTRSQRNALT